jgi:hypothetical protein
VEEEEIVVEVEVAFIVVVEEEEGQKDCQEEDFLLPATDTAPTPIPNAAAPTGNKEMNTLGSRSFPPGG